MRRQSTPARRPRPDGISVGNPPGSGVGYYRLVYVVDDEVIVITVVRVAYRREVYRDL
jgi:mRNA interferase RelE/StbE